jgi:hypothetical protein
MAEQTTRQRLRSALEQGWHSALELSQLLGIPEREVGEHLAHLARSLSPAGQRLVTEPPACNACGFVFVERRRPTRPSACPRCRQSRVTRPRFRIQREPR